MPMNNIQTGSQPTDPSGDATQTTQGGVTDELLPEGAPTGGEQPSLDELGRRLQEIKDANGKLESMQIASKNRINQYKMEILRQVYKGLEELGVDPNDTESINQFLNRLREENPDLVTLLEFILNNLVPEDEEENDQPRAPQGMEENQETQPIAPMGPQNI